MGMGRGCHWEGPHFVQEPPSFSMQGFLPLIAFQAVREGGKFRGPVAEQTWWFRQRDPQIAVGGSVIWTPRPRSGPHSAGCGLSVKRRPGGSQIPPTLPSLVTTHMPSASLNEL